MENKLYIVYMPRIAAANVSKKKHLLFHTFYDIINIEREDKRMFSKKELFSLIKGPVDEITYEILYNYLTSNMEEAYCSDTSCYNLTEEEVDDLNFRGIYLEGERWVGPKDEYDCFYKDYDEIELELLHIECKIVLCYLNGRKNFHHRIEAPIILSILEELGYHYNQLVANCIYNIKLY